jgi:hypothetical protein
MAAERQLVVAVEGTAALGPYWSAILGDYVEKIVRYARAPLAPLLFSSVPGTAASCPLSRHQVLVRAREGGNWDVGGGRCFRGNFFLILR